MGIEEILTGAGGAIGGGSAAVLYIVNSVKAKFKEQEERFDEKLNSLDESRGKELSMLQEKIKESEERFLRETAEMKQQQNRTNELLFTKMDELKNQIHSDLMIIFDKINGMGFNKNYKNDN